MAISTAICIPLNLPQMFQFPEKTPVALTHENKPLSFSLSLPPTMPVCKWNKASHATLAVHFRKYHPVCPTVMTTDAEIFFLRTNVIKNILYKDHRNAVL